MDWRASSAFSASVTAAAMRRTSFNGSGHFRAVSTGSRLISSAVEMPFFSSEYVRCRHGDRS